MAQSQLTAGRVDLRLDGPAMDQLDALCVDDVRTRALQLRWLIAEEYDRRRARLVIPDQLAARAA